MCIEVENKKIITYIHTKLIGNEGLGIMWMIFSGLIVGDS